MYLRMKVGLYKGEIRGPFFLENAKMLIARGDAVQAVPVGDGRFEVIEQEEAIPVDAGQTSKKGRK